MNRYLCCFDYRVFYVLILLPVLMFTGCAGEEAPPDEDSETYRQAVSDFHVSLAAGQTDEARFAFNKMNDVARTYPQEPAAWANLGVFAMRQGNFQLAEERFDQALELAPAHPEILFLAGYLQNRMGNMERAIEFFRKGIESDPENLLLQYALVEELEREDDIEHAEEILYRLKMMQELVPGNQVISYELARVAAKEQNLPLLMGSVETLGQFSGYWSPEAREQYELLLDVLETENFGDISLELSFLRNAIEPSPAFQEDLRQVKLASNEVGFPITEFLWLPEPRFRAADPDTDMTFNPDDPAGLPVNASFVTSVTLLEDAPPIAVHISDSRLFIGDDVELTYPGGDDSRMLPANVLAQIDYNYNFRNDIALAGPRGFRLYRHNEDSTFTDVTSEFDLPARVTKDAYKGIWAADLDLDGDLDLLLAAENGGVVVLRNNADGTFTRTDLFSNLENRIVDFSWADLDGDGAADALFLSDEGLLLFYRNLRGREFVKSDRLPALSGVSAFTIADLNANGLFDILVVRGDFSVERLYYQRRGDSWGGETLFRLEPDGEEPMPGSTGIFAHDLDNNGALDILVSVDGESWVRLADSELDFEPLEQELPGRIASVFDIDGNERLDLLGLAPDGSPFQLMNRGARGYHARSVRARASGLQGDQRINSYGIGGEMEMRSGLLYQKQPITSPIVHFGLGHYQEADMIRILWPNGSVQAEFAELGMQETILNEQILKGSCPWLFTHDGQEVQFITDALWRSPLGLRINAQETAGVIQTLDRVKIPGDKIAARDGIYDVRITAELWETHFFDYVELVAVDHREGTEVFIDERFVFPPPDLSTQVMKTPQPVSEVLDMQGRDVTATVSRRDGHYLKAFEKTAYQGLVEDHYIEIEIANEAPVGGPLHLVASGWLRPTDSSINLALSQGSHAPPRGLKIEVSDGQGGWELLHDDYGVPAGKLKTILVDLEGVFPDPADRRIRMHTSSEIYWDAIQWAEGVSQDQLVEQRLPAVRQELRHRGFSRWFRPDSVSPKLPDYSEISGTAPRWLDLTGYHTRFGDVSELLKEIDDRYVIMNAGDELLLEFEAPDKPAEGWTRSYVFVSDGWVKDGDYNTEASKTVEPLPRHDHPDYEYNRGGSLLDDPVYQKHREDWVRFHTRFVTPEPFNSALIPD